MAAPTNTTSATAVVMGSLPYTATQTVDDAGTTYSVYYTHTFAATGVYSINGFGDVSVYKPTTTVSSNLAGTSYKNITNYHQMPIYFNVVAGQQLWFRFISNAGNPSPAELHVTLTVVFADTTAPHGSLFINDASSASFPAALLDSETGEPLSYVIDFPGGESMVQLEDGTLLVQDIDTVSFKVYTGEYVFVATLPGIYNNIHLSSNRTTFFYTGNSSTNVITRWSALGTATGDTWNVASAPVALGIARDDSIAYFAAGTSGAAVKRWDLVNNVPLSDLVAGPGGYTTREMFVLGDGTVVVLRKQDATTVFSLIRYSAAGATLTTYTSLLADSDSTDAHLAFANDDPDSFWLWFKIANGFSRFVNIDTVAGTAISPSPFEQIHYTSGSYDGDDADVPDSYFGHSESCTFVITRLGSTPPTPVFTTNELIMRRVRRAPHISNEQKWVFYQQLQIDLEAGVGLVSGQGSDPQVMLRWSDDGGHTWSDEVWASAGALGQFKHRAMWRRLGKSRDRIFEVILSDPVHWNILSAFLQVDQGLS